VTLYILAGSHALLATGLAACLYLFALAKREWRAAGDRCTERLKTAQSEIEKLRGEIETLSVRLRDTEENAGMLVPPPPVFSGLNLGKRSQAIRLARRGEKPAQIAAELQIPAREVELLLKVHRIVLSAPLGEARLEQRVPS
jgi:hypothetical protein